MANITENIDPKKNPFTSFFGSLFLVLAFIMYAVKYLFPLFIQLKADVSYSDYIPAIMIFIGLILIFMSDTLFYKIFDFVLGVFKKKTNT